MLESKIFSSTPLENLDTKEKNLLEPLKRGVFLEGFCERLGSISADVVLVQAVQSVEKKNVRDFPCLSQNIFQYPPGKISIQNKKLTRAPEESCSP